MGVSEAVWMLGFSQECSTVLDFSTTSLWHLRKGIFVVCIWGEGKGTSDSLENICDGYLLCVCVCVCVCVWRERKGTSGSLESVCVWGGGGGEAVRTRAFLSSDGRIALLRPRWTDSVWESWKETTVCFLREMGLLQYTTLCCLSFAAFMKRAQWAAYLGSISWGICEQCVLQDLVFEEKVSIPPPPPPPFPNPEIKIGLGVITRTCILLAHWLFISTYKAHINALFCMTGF